MEFYLKNNKNLKTTFTIIDEDMDRKKALLLKTSTNYFEYIIVKNYKITGMEIEWNYGTYLGQFPKSYNYEKFKEETYRAKYLFTKEIYFENKKDNE